MTLAAVFLLIMPALAITAALSDASSFTIPNWISLALAGAFPLAALLAGLPLPALGLSLACGAAMLVVGIGMFGAGWIGGGDAKLLAAASLWIGWPTLVEFLLITTVAGGALAVALVGLRGAGLQPAVARGPAWLARLLDPQEAAPYGIAIAFGALAVFPSTPIFAAALG